jgi:hypothetical protein
MQGRTFAAHDPVETEPENIGDVVRTAGFVAKSAARRRFAPMFFDVGIHDV